MCERCAELEAEVAYLRGELIGSITDAQVMALARHWKDIRGESRRQRIQRRLRGE